MRETRKKTRLKRRKKAEKKKMRKIWYEGNPKKIIEYMKQSSEILENNWVQPDTQIYKSDKFFRWEIEPIEINDETIEKKEKR